MSKEEAYKKIEQSLFLSREEAARILTPLQLERKERWMICVAKKMEDPMILDKLLIDFLMSGCGGACAPVPQTTAYRDLAAVTRIFGNIQLSSKVWYRYMIVEGAKKAYAIAEKQQDAKGMAAALDKIGKYTRADKEDDAVDWDKIIPPSFEPSDDVTLLGDIEVIPNLEDRRKELRDLFRSQKYIEDAEIITDDNAT